MTSVNADDKQATKEIETQVEVLNDLDKEL
jgi:hypothetical protein